MLFRRIPLVVVFLTVAGTFWACDQDLRRHTVDPCAQVTCSGFGSCVLDSSAAEGVRCDCVDGFHAQGLACVPGPVPPTITSTPATELAEKTAFAYEVACTAAAGGPVTLSIDDADTCGTTLVDRGDGTGACSFFATEEEGGSTCVLSIACADDFGLRTLQTVEIAVTEANSAPAISNLPMTRTSLWGRSNHFQAGVNDGDRPRDNFTWDLAFTDCSFTPEVEVGGFVTWTCGGVQTCGIDLRVTDSGAPPLTDTRTLTVQCTDTAPRIDSTAPATAIEGMHYRYAVSCTDADGDAVTISVDPATDTCGGGLLGSTYVFVPTAAQGGATCTLGVLCSDTQLTAAQAASVAVADYTGNLKLRIVAGNLSSGNFMNWDPGHGIRIAQALHPDVVLMQEMNYLSKTPADYQALARAIVGAEHFAVDNAGFQIPNGVVSRWPVLACGYWDDPSLSNRELMWATLDLPGPMDLFVVSVHLHTSPSADQVAASLIIVNQIKAHKQANPGKYYYVVGGDFNGTTAVSSSGIGVDGTFAWEPPHPVDDFGNRFTNAPRNAHYDFVLGDPVLRGLQIPVVIESTYDPILRTYPAGLVFDTRTFTQELLDEFFPSALVSDSAATGMQHMAVVKDYQLN